MWINPTVCLSRCSGSIPPAMVEYFKGFFPAWSHSVNLSGASVTKMTEFPLDGTKQPVCIEEEGRNSTTMADRCVLFRKAKRKVKPRNTGEDAHLPSHDHTLKVLWVSIWTISHWTCMCIFISNVTTSEEIPDHMTSIFPLRISLRNGTFPIRILAYCDSPIVEVPVVISDQPALCIFPAWQPSPGQLMPAKRL